MLLKKYSHYIYRYFIAIFCFIFIFIRNAGFELPVDAENVLNYYKLCFGGIPSTGQFDIGSISLYLILNTIVLYCFSDFFKHDCLINYVYVFTRRGNKKTWLGRKTISLILNIFILYLIAFFFAYIISKRYGLQFCINNMSISSIFSMFILNIFSLFVLSFIQNFLSLRIGITQSFLIEIIYYVFCIVLALTLFNVNKNLNLLLFFLIPSNQMYLWHTGCTENNLSGYIFGNSLVNFELIHSYMILSLYTIITYIIARYIFEKLDLTEIIKEN